MTEEEKEAPRKVVDMSFMANRFINLTVKPTSEDAYWKLIAWLNDQDGYGIDGVECHEVFVRKVTGEIDTVVDVLRNLISESTELHHLRSQMFNTLRLFDTSDTQRKLKDAPLPCFIMNMTSFSNLCEASKQCVVEASAKYRWVNSNSIKASVEGFAYLVARAFYEHGGEFTEEQNLQNSMYLDEIQQCANGVNDLVLIDELISHVINDV